MFKNGFSMNENVITSKNQQDHFLPVLFFIHYPVITVSNYFYSSVSIFADPYATSSSLSLFHL